MQGRAQLARGGDLATLKAEDSTFAEVVSKGHEWFALPEHLEDSLKSGICQWMNQDQNENQPLTDGELVRMSLVAVKDFVRTAGPGVQMPLHSITLAATLSSPPEDQQRHHEQLLHVGVPNV